MSTVQEIENAVRHLSAEELETFRVWFAEFEAEMWDRQLERDMASGRLDKLAEEAIQDFREGRSTEL